MHYRCTAEPRRRRCTETVETGGGHAHSGGKPNEGNKSETAKQQNRRRELLQRIDKTKGSGVVNCVKVQNIQKKLDSRLEATFERVSVLTCACFLPNLPLQALNETRDCPVNAHTSRVRGNYFAHWPLRRHLKPLWAERRETDV